MSDASARPPSAEEAAASVQALLADRGRDVEVSPAGFASAGATRATLFVDITEGGETTGAVAQIRMPRHGSTVMASSTEGALVTLAENAGVAVGPILAASDSAPVIDREVLVAARIDGETIPRRVLRLIDAHPGSGERLGADCGEALARLHALDPSSAPADLDGPGASTPSEAFIERLREWHSILEQPYPTLRWCLGWLEANQPPPPPRLAIVHADFRNGNIIVAEPDSPDGPWLRAVLDWELAHIGDAMEDLAYLCLRTWRFGNDDLPVGGFGSLASLRSSYEEHGGHWRQDGFDWWLLARTIWWGIGLANQAQAFTQGLSTSVVHAASGRRVVELEYDALRLIEQLSA